MVLQNRKVASAFEKRVLDHLLAQFQERTAQSELRNMGPVGVDWIARTRSTILYLAPILPQLALHLQIVVPARLNSAAKAHALANQAHQHLRTEDGDAAQPHPSARRWAEELIAAAETAKSLIGNVDSQHVSAEIQRSVITFLKGRAKANGASLYPDVVLTNGDYTMLPAQKREKGQQIDGPCARGEHVSNVPDGLEIKTNQGHRIKVDAHAAHAGLHLGVTWGRKEEEVIITGVWAAYVRMADHSKPVRNVPTTTLKYSFGHDLFVSVLAPPAVVE